MTRRGLPMGLGILAALVLLGGSLLSVLPHSAAIDTPPASQETTWVPLFEQVWQTVAEKFYDPELNNVNWVAIRQRYQPQVAQARDREAAAAVINSMLAELNTSHTRLYIPEEPAYYQVLGIFVPRSSELRDQIQPFLNGTIAYREIGIITAQQEGKTFIKAVLDGSPAAAAGLQTGDQILSVDQQPFHPIRSFAGPAEQSVTVRIQRTPDPQSQQDVVVTPRLFDGTTMFLDAQSESVAVVEQAGVAIGYIHIWSYASDQAQQLLEQELLYGRLKEADALVLDLREGWGGAPMTVLNLYNDRDLSITNIPRNGNRYTSYSAWQKPVVMLVNEGSRSAKEILAYAFQQYGIGTVVGSRTAGAVVAGQPFVMQDGSLLYIAVADVYIDGNHRLEGVGVTPDVVVPAPLPYAQGADPQKERALAIAAEQVQQGNRSIPAHSS
ncbi:MAG: PDZ domain-containing protein [Synechococcales cyanobacterium C42_A2020_086]|nr:PDZ domain-containing protein [Synechococcales cyanobacterium C42_A2020_086]